ncbi:regulator of nucleoside diphosphate kinase [Flavobacteriaceae bacterium MAR_2010_105]|nr:regulator of nucleoside diphosphate kinase [Flavobacteriaceae bacterium MAR_2010_105]
MKYGSLILEKKEFVYLKRIINISGYEVDHEVQKSLLKLTEQLKTAHVLDEQEMPADVVRFNSIVTLSFENHWEKSLQIVQPADKDLKNNKISILTPMGAALFGYAVNDNIVWDFPAGRREIKIIEVAQEKKDKNFDLIFKS